MLTFGIFSDLHNSKGDFENVINNVYELSDNGKSLDSLIMVGDIVYLPTGESMPSADTYAMINSNPKFQELKSSGRLIFAMGNHEFPLHNRKPEVCDLAKRVFREETGLTPEKVTVIDGYHFITAGPNSYANDLSEEQEDFIIESVTKALNADPVKPVFLFVHEPVDNTLYGSEPYDFYSERLENFLKHEPRLVMFSGHMHFPSSDPQTILQIPGGTTFIYTSSIMGGNGAKTPYTTDRHRSWPCQAIMMNVDTDSNKVIIKRFYVSPSSPKYLEGGDWILDIPAMIGERGKEDPDTSIYKYTDKRCELSRPPYFAEGDGIEVRSVSETGATLFLPVPRQSAEGEDSVGAYYIAELYNKTEGSPEKTSKILTDYFLENKNDYFKYNISNLTPATDWSIKITPVTPWYVEGTNSVTADFSTLAPRFEDAEFDEECTLVYNVSADAKFNGDRTNYGTFIMIAGNWETEFEFKAELDKTGKYRAFLSSASVGNAAFVGAAFDSNGKELAKGDNVTITGGYTNFKEVPFSDVDIKEKGSYTFKFVTPSCDDTISIKDLILKKHK